MWTGGAFPFLWISVGVVEVLVAGAVPWALPLEINARAFACAILLVACRALLASKTALRVLSGLKITSGAILTGHAARVRELPFGAGRTLNGAFKARIARGAVLTLAIVFKRSFWTRIGLFANSIITTLVCRPTLRNWDRGHATARGNKFGLGFVAKDTITGVLEKTCRTLMALVLARIWLKPPRRAFKAERLAFFSLGKTRFTLKAAVRCGYAYFGGKSTRLARDAC